MYLTIYAYFMYTPVRAGLCISEMNDNGDARSGREEIGCYYKVLTTHEMVQSSLKVDLD